MIQIDYTIGATNLMGTNCTFGSSALCLAGLMPTLLALTHFESRTSFMRT